MGNQPLEPIKEGALMKRPLSDYFTKVKKIGKGSYGSVKLFESKIDFKKYAIKKIKTF